MNRPMNLTHKKHAVLFSLLCVAMASPMLMVGTPSTSWLPEWFAAAVGVAALLGVLLVCRASGALRTGFLVCFVLGLVIAAFAGDLLTVLG